MLDAVLECECCTVAEEAGLRGQALLPEVDQGLRVVPAETLRHQGQGL